MYFATRLFTSVHGRRLGLTRESSAQHGGAGFRDYLTGDVMDAIKPQTSSAASTGTDLKPFGAWFLPTSSAGSSQVYTIEPPIPGVPVTVMGGTASEVFLKSKNSEVFVTSGGSSFTVINPSSLGFTLHLVGMTTAMWGVINGSTAAGHAYTTST